MEEARLQEAIREIQAGDPDALAEIWRAYARRVPRTPPQRSS